MNQKFDSRKAEKRLREVFMNLEIKRELNVTRKQIRKEVNYASIKQIQKERLENLPKAQAFKAELIKLFPELRFEARLKSLYSIFGKILKHRTTADAFGINVVTETEEACYGFYEWAAKQYTAYDLDDRIKNPKPNGYRDLKFIICYEDFLIEFIVQTQSMYIDARTLQAHELVYPWKYHDVLKNLPAEYQAIKF